MLLILALLLLLFAIYGGIALSPFLFLVIILVLVLVGYEGRGRYL